MQLECFLIQLKHSYLSLKMCAGPFLCRSWILEKNKHGKVLPWNNGTFLLNSLFAIPIVNVDACTMYFGVQNE